MPFPKIKFTYFDKIDRPEPVRLAMMMAGIPYEDDRITHDQWRQMKDSSPFGSLPTMEVDGKVFSQANALLRYVGHIGSMLPTDPIKAMAVDQVIGAVDDIIFAVKPTLHIEDGSRKIFEQGRLASEYIPRVLAGLDRVICEDSKGFCVGDRYSIADVVLFNMVHWFKIGTIDGIPREISDKHPNICQVYDKVASREDISKWLKDQSREQ